jgi:hypothetical protein
MTVEMRSARYEIAGSSISGPYSLIRRFLPWKLQEAFKAESVRMSIVRPFLHRLFPVIFRDGKFVAVNLWDEGSILLTQQGLLAKIGTNQCKFPVDSEYLSTASMTRMFTIHEDDRMKYVGFMLLLSLLILASCANGPVPC